MPPAMTSAFAPTPAETTLVHQIFLQADPQKLGVVTGEAAVKVFDRANLSPAVLADIWAIADDENNGWLSRKGVAKAVRLIGHCQAGRPLSEDLLKQPGPLAKFDGITPIAQQNTGVSAVSLPKSPLPTFPVLTPQDHEKYLNIFRRAGPVNGLLSGEKARDIFLKSKLPNEQLIQIWNLADTQDRGALDSTDFSIGMYFINGLMSKTISFIPTSLPPGLYQQAGGVVANHLSGGSISGSFSPVSSAFSVQSRPTGPIPNAIQPNHTGMSSSSGHTRPAPALPARPLTAQVGQPFRAPPPPVPAAQVWDITPAEKANFDSWFDNLDTGRLGYIEGDVAVPFMLQSNLPGDTLALVWDLADINNDGRLTRDGFAVAMYLIQKKLAGVEVPDKLPLSLIPPSMRGAASQQTQSQLTIQPPQQPVRDLFSFDDSPPPSAISPQQTGAFAPLQPQQTGALSSLQSHNTGTFSALGMQATGGPSAMAPSHTGSTRNFLDDDEPHVGSPSLQDKSAEIGNTKNQLASTTRSLESAKAERAALEETLANQASQLSSLQTQLSSAKAAYETEVKLLSTLKDRYNSQLSEIQKTREELIRAESDLSALKVEKAEIEGAFLRDKEDARDLHRRMIEAGQQADAIKLEVEKVKRDAKQQKGLLAIAKKQLSSKEAEKAKAQTELEEATAELTAITSEQKEVEAKIEELESAMPPSAEVEELESALSPKSVDALTTPPAAERAGSVDSVTFAAAQPLPNSPSPSLVASPTPSMKSNNPFDRLRGDSTPRSQSPFTSFTAPATQPEKQGSVFSEDLFFGNDDKEKEGSAEGLPYDAEEPPKAATNGLPTLNVPDLNGAGLGVPREEVASPALTENDLFHTPPTSARNLASPTVETAETAFPAIDDFTSHFTAPPAPEGEKKAVEDGEVKAELKTEGKGEEKKEELKKEREPTFDATDFTATFNFDKEVEESDSSSDEEDEVPLSQVKQNVAAQAKEKEKTPETTNAFDDIFGSDSQEPPKLQEKSTEEKGATSSNTFDDIFGSSAPPAKTNGSGATTDGFASSAFPVSSAPPAVPVAGVDAFDEALGKLSGNTSTAPSLPAPQFPFNANFEATFDFAAAKAEFSPTPEPSQHQQQGTTSAFDDIFGSTSTTAAPTTNGRTSTEAPTFNSAPPQAKSQEVAPALSFDDIFSGEQVVKPNGAAEAKPAAAAASSSPPPEPSTTESSTAFPVSSPTQSPKATGTPQPQPQSILRPSSPLAERIPAARAQSPKPRLSTSSSKEGDKAKEPPVRHSKISLRLPFGRKKKDKQQQHEPMPSPPSSHLSPHPEVDRTPTPAVDDDVEAVKQLTSMGFSRSQAVEALEKYGYDVQLALNALLQY